jgi:hypothetical protein
MPSLNAKSLQLYIARILSKINMYSIEAEAILLGTAAVESDMGRYVTQINGPALGIFQMEPTTYIDICKNVIPSYWHKLKNVILPQDPIFLKYDLHLEIIMCRLQYARFPNKLPAATDIEEQAALWKLLYNTPLGKGTKEKYIEKYKQYIGDLYKRRLT